MHKLHARGGWGQRMSTILWESARIARNIEMAPDAGEAELINPRLSVQSDAFLNEEIVEIILVEIVQVKVRSILLDK